MKLSQAALDRLNAHRAPDGRFGVQPHTPPAESQSGTVGLDTDLAHAVEVGQVTLRRARQRMQRREHDRVADAEQPPVTREQVNAQLQRAQIRVAQAQERVVRAFPDAKINSTKDGDVTLTMQGHGGLYYHANVNPRGGIIASAGSGRWVREQVTRVQMYRDELADLAAAHHDFRRVRERAATAVLSCSRDI